MSDNNRNYTESEKAFLNKLESEYLYDSEYDQLLTEFNAINIEFSRDKRVLKLIMPLRAAIDYISSHSNIPKEDIIEKVNEIISYIDIVKEYKDNPNGIGYVDGFMFGLSLKEDVIDDEMLLYEFLRHELTHIMGETYINKMFKKFPYKVSGYTLEDVFSEDETPYKENEYFNESAVEMFVAQDDEFRVINAFGIDIYTNQYNDEGLYSINGNLLRQMLLARGVSEEDLFCGLFDYNDAKRVIGRLDRSLFKRNFKRVSKNMDQIAEDILSITDVDEERDLVEGIKSKIGETEMLIIDNFLCPSLRGLSEESRQEVLDNYYKVIMCERDYFATKTNYRALTVSKKISPVFEHIDVEPLVVNSSKEKNEEIKRANDNDGIDLE